MIWILTPNWNSNFKKLSWKHLSAQESCTIGFPGGWIDKISSAFLIWSLILFCSSFQAIIICSFPIHDFLLWMQLVQSENSTKIIWCDEDDKNLYLCFEYPAFAKIKEKETIRLRCCKIQISKCCPKADESSINNKHERQCNLIGDQVTDVCKGWILQPFCSRIQIPTFCPKKSINNIHGRQCRSISVQHMLLLQKVLTHCKLSWFNWK